MAGKEGESYLDQLLNNASTPPQEAGLEKVKESARKAELDNVGLQEALAVLNDLPDETGIPSKTDPKEELEDLKNLYEEFGNEIIPEKEPEPESMAVEPEAAEEPEMPAADSETTQESETVEAPDIPLEEVQPEAAEEPEIPAVELEIPEEETEQMESTEPDILPEKMQPEEPDILPEEMQPEESDMPAVELEMPEETPEEPGVSEMPEEETEQTEPAEPEIPVDEMQSEEPETTEDQEPAFEDMEAMLDLLQQPEEESVQKEAEMPEETKEPEVSKEPVAVEDIFQDALSAVGYSGDEEDLEQEMDMPEVQSEGQDPQLDDILALDDIMQNASDEEESGAAEEGVQSVPVRKQKKEKKKKPGLWKRLFGNVVTDETAALEQKEREAEEEAFLQKQAALIEKKKQSEADKEEKEKKNQEEKERKKQIKAEKDAQKAEKKAEKKRLKEERAAMAEQEVVGKINPIGATIVFILFATIGVLIFVGVWLLPRRANIKEAQNEYANEKYIEAYQTISAVSIKEDEQALYDKIVLCSKLERQIQSYKTNVSMKQKLEALHALLQGLDLYNKKQDEVKALKIQNEFLQMKTQIITYLAQDYNLDEAQANEINAITDEAEYTRRLLEIVAAVK